MLSTALVTAHAAVCLPMAWLTQSQFPPKKAVIESFKNAVSFLKNTEDPDAVSVRMSLETIIAGTDPRGGTFAKQALAAAGKLHDFNARLTVQALDAAENNAQPKTLDL